MNTGFLRKTLALGALTGMRSMAGPAALAFRDNSVLKPVVGVLAAAELIADKTSFVGNRIDAAPLAGRAVLGALVGGIVAHEEHGNIAFGGLMGAAAAIVAAHLAFAARRRLAGSSMAGGFVEDALVLGLGAMYATEA
jgi:uncharacterized membrane protein